MEKIIEKYFDKLWPICRSLTGNGNRRTLKILSEIINFNIKEVKCGTKCFDWNIPPEWNINEAWIKDKSGRKIIDFSKNNLHILGYSSPVNQVMSYYELKNHLYTLPDQPDLIPYLTSYYERQWGFCLSHNQMKVMNKKEDYKVFIDSDFNENGSMTYADLVIPGESKDEILISTYFCHPSMANNELSGPLVTAMISKEVRKIKNRRFTYRFVYVPETIGSIFYLSKYGDHLKKYVKAGFVVTCVGDSGLFTYKKSKVGNSLTDRCAEIVLKQTENNFNIIDFFPSGSDERQYCSEGFNLPIGSLMRTMYGKYKEYHTSGDDKNFISFTAMKKSIEKYMEIINVIELNKTYTNNFPNCEPQLGKRGLYPPIYSKDNAKFIDIMMWILSFSDGKNDMIYISEKSGFSIKELLPVVDILIDKNIISLS
tara:strand:+ start:6115 stop:7392 length:1278 start_codon:yes stop_codon:yes gene_type:complete